MKRFGPNGVAIPHSTLDLKPGEVFHNCMRGPDGKHVGRVDIPHNRETGSAGIPGFIRGREWLYDPRIF